MPQTSMSLDYTVGLAGQIVYPTFPQAIIKKIVELSGGIPFGMFCARAANGTVKLPTTSGEVTATGSGFSQRDPSKPYDSAGYANGESISIIRKGYLWVDTEGAVAEEGAVFARFTASGGNTQLGKCRADADTGTAVAVPNARFLTSTSGAGLAIVELI